MAYVVQSEIEAAIPPQHLVDALDDDRDGVTDAGQLAAVIANGSLSVDALLAPVFTVPFTSNPIPPAVRRAALVFTCELIYVRRERAGEAGNPFAKEAEEWRERLGKVGAGELPLDAGLVKVFQPGAVVADASAVDSSSR